MVIEQWCADLGWKLTRSKKAQALVAEGRIGSDKAVMVFPQTYMNASGGAVKVLMNFYKIDAEHIIVLHDELDIPFEAIRIKHGGGDNGHNGLKSIRSALGSGDWYRVRLGIGRPPGQGDAAAFVLKAFASAEKKQVPTFISRSIDAIETLMSHGLDVAQSRFNQ
jgi:PTH1 family peptidyl-tRNA hydrolase